MKFREKVKNFIGKDTQTFLMKAGIITSLLFIIPIVVYVTISINKSDRTPYDDMNDSLLTVQLFVERNSDYLDEVIKYVDEPTDERLTYLRYREIDVKTDWVNTKKEIRNGKNKNVFGERKLTDYYYQYMNTAERDILRNYYFYVEETLKLVEEYDKMDKNNQDPENMKIIVDEMIKETYHADEKINLVLHKYIQNKTQKEL